MSDLSQAEGSSHTSSQDRPRQGVSDSVSQLIKLVQSLDQKSKELEKKLVLLEKDIDKVQRGNLEQLGVFVALFTFVSLSFQIGSQQLTYGEFLLLTSFFAGLLIFFVSIIVLTIEKNIPWKSVIWLVISLLIYLFIALKISNCDTSSLCHKLINR